MSGQLTLEFERPTRTRRVVRSRRVGDPVPPKANVIVWAPGRIALRCYQCNGLAATLAVFRDRLIPCDVCQGCGFIGILPGIATSAERGSETKVAVLVARQAAGAPLWVRGDREEDVELPQRAPDPFGWDLFDDQDDDL